MNRLSFFYIGIFAILVSLLSFLNIIYSYYFNLYLNLNNYVYAMVVSLIFGVIFTLKKKDEVKINIYEKILIVLLGYFLLPVFISIPYYLSIYNISLVDSYFESVSGFTSTGFSIFTNIKHIDESIILWRSSSQWIGGLYFLFSIIFLIDIFDTNLKKSLTNFLSFNSSEILKQFFKILIYYSILTFTIFLILIFFKIRLFDSFNLSMSLISSGGFLPVNNLGEIIDNNKKKLVLSLLMLLSFFSLYMSYNLIKIKKNINFLQEDFYLVIYLFFLIMFFSFSVNSIDQFSSTMLALSSSISNIGFSLNNSYHNNSFIFIILTIVGGSFFSTSSGIRFVKLYSLFKFSINELISHVRPKNVYITKLDYSNSKIEIEDSNKFFLSVLIFIFSLFILSSLLAFSNINFENSFKLSVLTLMNTVNSSIHGIESFNFLELKYYTKYSLIFFMIVGRVELLTLLIVFKKFFFKN